MSFFKNLFPKSKEKKHKENLDYLSKNYHKLIDYWGGTIAGDIKLEDGSTFSDGTFYNTKYLKYRKDHLEQASIYNAKTTKDKKVYKTSKPTLYLLQKHDELFGINPQDIADEFYKPINTSPEYPYSGNY